MTRLLVAALAFAASACEEDPPPIAPDVRPPDPEPGIDASVDAGADAAPDAEAPPAHGDTCDDAIDIRADYEPGEDGAYHIQGDLDAFRNDLETCGLAGYDADAVYVYVPPTNGLLRTRLGEGDYADVIVQTSCGEQETNLSCVSYPGVACSEGPCGHLDPVSAGVPMFVVVDGRRTAARTYELELQLHPWAREGEECAEADPARTCRPPQICRVEDDASRCRAMTCGDGIVEGDLFAGLGEECDDGNAESGDGCSEACTLAEQGPAGDACADAVPFHVVETHPDLFLQAYGFGVSDTTGAAADLEGSCAPSAASADQVWTITVDQATPFTVAVAPEVEGYLPLLYLLAQEADTCGATELACATGDEVNLYTALEIESLEPGTYYLVVDGVDGDAVTEGPYSIEAVFATL